MDDLIYLLLFVAWIGIALYRNSQKKKMKNARKEQPGPTGGETSEQTRSPGSLLEEILMGEEDIFTERKQTYSTDESGRIYSRQPEITTDFEEEEVVLDFDDEYNRRGITSIEELDLKPGNVESDEGETPSEDLQIVELEGEEKEPFDFDLRQAVIYSEILDRRYF
jgi:hypothetical protein